MRKEQLEINLVVMLIPEYYAEIRERSRRPARSTSLDSSDVRPGLTWELWSMCLLLKV